MMAYPIHLGSFGLQLLQQFIGITGPFDLEGVMRDARRSLFGGVKEA
jgi:hypothetical protein